jgi:hypothetical protein
MIISWKMSHRNKGEHRMKLRRKGYGKAETDGQTWLSDDPYEVETS